MFVTVDDSVASKIVEAHFAMFTLSSLFFVRTMTFSLELVTT